MKNLYENAALDAAIDRAQPGRDTLLPPTRWERRRATLFGWVLLAGLLTGCGFTLAGLVSGVRELAAVIFHF